MVFYGSCYFCVIPVFYVFDYASFLWSYTFLWNWILNRSMTNAHLKHTC